MKKSKKINILVYLQDEGSSNYLINYLKLLKIRKEFLFYIILNSNVKFKRKIIEDNFNNFKILKIGKHLSKNFFNQIIDKYKINKIYCTFAQNKIDKSNNNLFMINKRIKIFTFLDSWKNIERFKIIKNKNITIGVINKKQRDYLLCRFKNVFTIGHPELSKINKLTNKNRKKILLVSDPDPQNDFKSIFFKNIKDIFFIKHLLDYLNLNYPNHKYYFRYHPKEKKIYNNFLFSNKITIDDLNESKSLLNYDILIGFEAMFLYKGLLSGRKTYFIKKNSIHQNFSSFNEIIYKISYYKLKNEIKVSKNKINKINNLFINDV